MTRRTVWLRMAAFGFALAVGLLPLMSALAYDWPQFDGSAQHLGNNTTETTITQANVANLTRVYQTPLVNVADGAPAYLSGITISGTPHDMLFLTTKDGHILALDAHSHATLWSHQNGPGNCHINNGGTVCYTTSSPAIDPNRGFVYTYGLDGKAHKYAVDTGAETITGGWPETTTLKPNQEKGSSALSVATARNGKSYLYVANGGYPGDNGDYQGHITAIDLATGAQNVFNAVCSNQTMHFTEGGSPDCPSVQTAIWARVGVVYSPATDKIYMSTGNGDFAATSHYWGDTVFSLNPDGTGANGNPLDTYTPTEYQQLQNADADIGSTAPVLLPTIPGSNFPHLALQSGKDAKIRLISLDDLSGQGGPGHTGGELLKIDVPQGGEVLTTPAVWVNPVDRTIWVFVVNDNGISALKVGASGGIPTLSSPWQHANGGSSPIIANDVLYYAGDNIIRALNPVTGATLWSDNTIGGIHWESPIVADGELYITDQSGNLSAYTLNGALARHDHIGVFRPSNNTFYLRNSNTTGFADLVVVFNPAANAAPLVGDWNGDGVDTIGVFDRNSGTFYLRNTNTAGAADVAFRFGGVNDLPLSGRWKASATHDGIGVFRPGNGVIYLRHTLNTGFADIQMVMGIPNDRPVAGDWNGDHVDSPGVARAGTSEIIYLSNQAAPGLAATDRVLVFGVPGDVPIAGDWVGAGHDGIGVFRPTSGLIYLKNVASTGFANAQLVYGIANDIPLAGHWTSAAGIIQAPAPIDSGVPEQPTPSSSGTGGSSFDG